MILRIQFLLRAMLLTVALAHSPLFAQHAEAQSSKFRVTRDIEYANHQGVSLKLDLYLPSNDSTPVPCVIFVHGGGWNGGSKKSADKNAAWLTSHGFAIASIDYRLTDVAHWPGQIDDCYAAVRWVRENGDQRGIDPIRVGAWGTSAGGHLVALMGTRPCPDSETVSSRVQAVCDWFGPTELLTMPPNKIGNGRTEADIAQSNGAKLLGATVREVPKLAMDASAINHVSPDDAEFLIMHGDQDPGVPVEQSTKLHASLTRSGVNSQLHIVAGAKHGGAEFQTGQSRDVVLGFFQRTLKRNWNQGAIEFSLPQ